MVVREVDWADVLTRLLANDRLAFVELNRLITATLSQLRAYDFREEWDDLRQEVLLALVASAQAGRVREPQALVGYVRIVTRNKFMDRLKRHLSRSEDAHLPWDDETAQRTGTTTPDVRLHDLDTALGTLTDDERRVIHGVYGEDKTYQEVSDAAGLPLGTMKRRLRSALTTLKRRVAGEAE